MALGVVGLSFGDFCRMTFGEFEAVVRAFNEREMLRQQGEWERLRLHAAMTMQPHCRHRIDPKKLMPFEWEKKQGNTANSVTIPDREEAKKAFMRRIGKLEEKE